QPAKPTIALPAGVHFANQRQRFVAMGIDLAVLLGLFLFASLVIAPAIDSAVHKSIVDRIDQLKTELDSATKESDRLSKAASDAAKAKGKNSAEAKSAKQASSAYDAKQLKDATNQYNDETRKLVPLNLAISAGSL